MTVDKESAIGAAEVMVEDSVEGEVVAMAEREAEVSGMEELL